MSNMVTLTVTKFADLDMAGNECDVNYGFRIVDSYASDYADSLTREQVVGKTPAELFTLAADVFSGNDAIGEMFTSAKQNNDGIIINGVFYSWAELEA